MHVKERTMRVVHSIENDHADRCVDIFVRPDGSFGFEEWRREPEEPGRWFRSRYHSGTAFASREAATAAAAETIAWLGARRDA